MKTKAKKFSHKLLALFLAVVLSVTCFSGVLTAYGSSISEYYDDNVEYNELAWDILSDEQVATALLDYADEMLAEYGPQIDKLLANNLPTSGTYYYSASSRCIGLNVGGIIKENIKVYVHSVDEIFETLESVNSLLTNSTYKSFIGDAKNIQLSCVSGVRRSNTSSTDIIRRVLAILQTNSCDYNGKDVIGEFLRGGFDLGTVGSLASIDIYDLLGNAFGLDDGYETNLVYNLVQQIIFDNTDWYTDAEIAAFKNGTATFVYDDQLLDKLTTKLLDRISVLVTYNQEQTDDLGNTIKADTSATRYKEIKAEMEASGTTYAVAAAKLGYDPNIVYTDEYVDNDGNYKNVLLFAYGSPDENGLATSDTEMIKLDASSNLFDFGYQALKMAWNTVLEGTVKLLHVNYSAERGHGTNFDNVFYYWMDANNLWTGDSAKDYSEANVKAWAESAYGNYGAASADEFLTWVKANLEFDRSVADDATGIWSDIDQTSLFNKLRYSPLADLYFDIPTGPINLYFLQLGTPNLDSFFENDYSGYSSLVSALNDALVAAVKDIFVSSDNIDGTVPTMATTGDLATINSTSISKITDTLVSNALKMVQYTADATDKNILNGFYQTYGKSATLTEKNLEEAMIPMLIACIGEVNLGTGKLSRVIHTADWDGCKDAEAVAFVCLREYLTGVLPDKNYDGLVTVDDDGTIHATLEGTLLPMARDAVTYVMQGYVPIQDKDGNEWRVESRTVGDKATLFDLLNSVVCYYGADYDMSKSDDRAMGVASLIGLCDTNGVDTLVSGTTDALWTNLDQVVNKFFPVIGTLQYGDSSYYGKASTKDLIWNDIVLGFLEIGDTSIHSSGKGGVSNFLNKLLTIVSAEPIQSTPIVTTVYNVIKDLANGLFGARYSGQSFTTIIPDATSSHPFDDLVQVGTLAGTSGTDLGALQKAICNFVEFSGYGTSGVSTYPDSIIRGLMFAVQAVNSFIPEAISNISDHTLKMASAEFAEATVTGASGTKTTTVDITNNSTGINNAYVDGMKDTNRVTQLSRYYLKVKKATISGSGNCSIDSPNNAIVAPGQTLSLNTSTTYVADANDSSSYEVVITYDIVDKNGNAITDADGNVLFTNLTTFCYQYMSGKTSWKEEVYPDGLVSTSTSNYNVKTTSGFGSGSYLKVTYPEYMVLGTTSLSDISSYNLILANTKGGVTAADRSLDGAFFYDEGTVYTNDLTTAESTYNSSASQVTVTSANAIPVYNTETGDLLHEEWYDYRVETYAGSGVYGEWQRNQVTEVTNENNSTAITFYKGYTEDEISSFVKSANSSGLAIETRTHVVYTLQEALDAKIIKAYHVNANGVYDAMYLQSGVGNYKYDDLLNIITMRGPVDGIYMNSTKIKLSKGSTSNFSWFRYDGSTAIQAGSYEVKLNCYNGNSCGYANFTLVIGDTSSVDSLATSYNELASLLTNYRKSDFTDYNKDTGTSDVFDEAQAALLNALGAQSAVLTPTSALTLSDDTQLTAVTKQTTSQTGDKAYVPFTTANDSTLPNSIKDAAYVGGATVNGDTLPGVAGVYYYDANCTMPIYSSVPLTSKDVDKDGNDPAGMPVIEVDGVYYLANSVVYETEWDTETYGATAPWAVATDTQATNSKGQLLYDQVQYVYRNASGSKVNSTDNWVCKLPQTSYQLIPNTGDANEEHRGTITQAADYITYAKEMVLSSINTSIAQDLYEKVSLVRDNLNSKNFEVVTYNKMVDAAKEAESNYSVVITYTNDDGEQVQQTVSYSSSKSIIENLKNKGVEYTVTTSSTLSSLQVEEYLRLFNFYMSKVVERGYIGDALEAEIECASGNSYANLVATKATYDEDGNQLTTATVTKGTSAGDPAFGAWSADGTLVNEGATVYSEKTWNAYVDALANAVYLATLGNTTYAHADRAYYDVSDKDNYSARVTGVATADVELQKAEIALTEVASVTITGVETAGATLVVDGTSYTSPVTFEKGETVTIDAIIEDGYTYSGYVLVNGDKKFTSLPFDLYLEKDYEIQPVVEASAPEGITISGTITIAKDAVGTDSGFAVEGINIVAGGEVVATSASDGTFTATVPVGTTELKITGDTTVDRTVTLSGTTDVTDVVIPVIDCDYNRDTFVNMTDFSTFLKYYEVEYYAYADFNGDKTVNMTDLTSFLKIYDNDVVYDALSLD